MKTLASASLLLAFFAHAAASGDTTAPLRLETRLYVYRDSDFVSVGLPASAGTAPQETRVISSPAALTFDDSTLSLDGSSFAWSGGKPPAGFGLVSSPAIVVNPGQSAAILSAAPVQYVEKAPDGSLKVHDIPADSPDAPHCRLTFTVTPDTVTRGLLRLECLLDLATLAGREEVPGVTLDIGKPVLARLDRRIEALVRVGDWTACATSSPGDADYSLLMLLRVVPETATVGGAPSPDGAGLMSPEALDRFATFYYLNPQPDRIDEAIRAFGASGFAKDRGNVFIGFFSAVFAANPDRVAGWRRTIGLQDNRARECLRAALKRSVAKSLLDDDAHSVPLNDARWGAFFASGDTAYLRVLAGEMKLFDSTMLAEFWAGATAQWSLARNAPEHPAVVPLLMAVRESADPRTRELADTAIAGNLPAIKQAIDEARHTRKFRTTQSSGDMGWNNWGTINPGPVGAQAGERNRGR